MTNFKLTQHMYEYVHTYVREIESKIDILFGNIIRSAISGNRSKYI